MKVLIVHAHHEPRSFSSALCGQAAATLAAQGHQVKVSDLYAQGFDPVSDRRNFTSVCDPDFLKQQFEERHASLVDGFAPALEDEIRKLEWCDLLIFNFPLWWFGMPAILKGWVDRAFPMRRIYGDGKLYENGIGGGVKRAMVMMTTGGGPDAYGGYGVSPALKSILTPIEHGIFWFNGFRPLAPFVAWSPARITQPERAAFLAQLDERLRSIESEVPRTLAPLADFPGFGKDSKKRYLAIATLVRDTAGELVPPVPDPLPALERDGVVLSVRQSGLDASPWRMFLEFRETSAEAVRAHLATLPLAPLLDFEVVELRAGS